MPATQLYDAIGAALGGARTDAALAGLPEAGPGARLLVA
jgi:hypothetical protein